MSLDIEGLCEWCGEKFDSVKKVEVDCGLVIKVYDHGTWTCPPEEERVPYDHDAVVRGYNAVR